MPIPDILVALRHSMQLLPKFPKIPLPTLYVQLTPTSPPAAGGPENIYQFILALIPNPVAIITGLLPHPPSVTLSVGSPPSTIVNNGAGWGPSAGWGQYPPPASNKTMPPLDFLSFLLAAYKDTLWFKKGYSKGRGWGSDVGPIPIKNSGWKSGPIKGSPWGPPSKGWGWKPPPTTTTPAPTTPAPMPPPKPTFAWLPPALPHYSHQPIYLPHGPGGPFGSFPPGHIDPGLPFIPFQAMPWDGPNANGSIPFDPYWNEIWGAIRNNNASAPPMPAAPTPAPAPASSPPPPPPVMTPIPPTLKSGTVPWFDQVYFSTATDSPQAASLDGQSLSRDKYEAFIRGMMSQKNNFSTLHKDKTLIEDSNPNVKLNPNFHSSAPGHGQLNEMNMYMNNGIGIPLGHNDLWTGGQLQNQLYLNSINDLNHPPHILPPLLHNGNFNGGVGDGLPIYNGFPSPPLPPSMPYYGDDLGGGQYIQNQLPHHQEFLGFNDYDSMNNRHLSNGMSPNLQNSEPIYHDMNMTDASSERMETVVKSPYISKTKKYGTRKSIKSSQGKDHTILSETRQAMVSRLQN